MVEVYGASVNGREGRASSTVLHEACYYNQDAVAEYFLSVGALCCVKNTHGETPLDNARNPKGGAAPNAGLVERVERRSQEQERQVVEVTRALAAACEIAERLKGKGPHAPTGSDAARWGSKDVTLDEALRHPHTELGTFWPPTGYPAPGSDDDVRVLSWLQDLPNKDPRYTPTHVAALMADNSKGPGLVSILQAVIKAIADPLCCTDWKAALLSLGGHDATEAVISFFLYTCETAGKIPAGEKDPENISVYKVMNGAMLAHGKPWDNNGHRVVREVFRPFMWRLDRSLRALPKRPTHVHRGMAHFTADTYADLTDIVWPCFSSTSLNERVAKEFSGVHDGVPGLRCFVGLRGGVDIAWASRYQAAEAEVLVTCNTRFGITWCTSDEEMQALNTATRLVMLQELSGGVESQWGDDVIRMRYDGYVELRKKCESIFVEPTVRVGDSGEQGTLFKVIDRAVERRRGLFLVGDAGSGKSTTMFEMAMHLNAQRSTCGGRPLFAIVLPMQLVTSGQSLPTSNDAALPASVSTVIVPMTAAPAVQHTVSPGESVAQIAQSYGVSPDAVRAANRTLTDVLRERLALKPSHLPLMFRSFRVVLLLDAVDESHLGIASASLATDLCPDLVIVSARCEWLGANGITADAACVELSALYGRPFDWLSTMPFTAENIDTYLLNLASVEAHRVMECGERKHRTTVNSAAMFPVPEGMLDSPVEENIRILKLKVMKQHMRPWYPLLSAPIALWVAVHGIRTEPSNKVSCTLRTVFKLGLDGFICRRTKNKALRRQVFFRGMQVAAHMMRTGVLTVPLDNPWMSVTTWVPPMVVPNITSTLTAYLAMRRVGRSAVSFRHRYVAEYMAASAVVSGVTTLGNMAANENTFGVLKYLDESELLKASQFCLDVRWLNGAVGCPSVDHLDLRVWKAHKHTAGIWLELLRTVPRGSFKEVLSLVALPEAMADKVFFLEGVVSGCPQLSSVNVSYCKSITDEDLVYFTWGQLHSLDVSFCDKITDLGVCKEVAQKCSFLQHLVMGGCDFQFCDKITDVGLQALAATCHQLQSVDFRLCDKITDVGLKALAATCHQLQNVKCVLDCKFC